LPAPWTQSDIGDVTQPGSTKCDPDGTLELTGALGGKPPLGGGTHYVYQMLDGDGAVVARFDHLSGSENGRRALVGVMMRESLDVGSRAVDLAFDPALGVRWRWRNQGAPGAFTLTSTGSHTRERPGRARGESGGWSNHGMGEFNTPLWLKLSRKGDTFTGSASLDGKAWSQIFSQNVEMGPDMRAGLMGAINGSQPSQSAWTDIQVNGVVAAPPQPAATGTTPLGPPWDLIDIGGPTQHGTAEWSGSDLRVSSSVPLNQGNTRNYTLVYQTIHGDGEIEGHLESQRESGYQSFDGLAIRSRLDPNSPEINFYRINANQLGYYVSADTVEQALKYYKRVAELDPKNQPVLMQIASQFQQAKRPGDAVDVYTAILKADFPTAMSQYGNMMQAFADANRLPDLLKIIDDWTQPPFNPMGGGGQDMYFILVQVGNQLKQGQHLPEAERVYRKALALDTFQSKQDGVAALAQVLMDENRRDDAATEVEKWLMDQGAPKTAAPPPPILGFNYQVQQQNNWFQSMGWNQNGTITSPIIHFLELAVDLGLTTKLEQELRARADKKGPSSVGLIDQDRMTCVILAILSRDSSYRADVEKLLKENPVSAPNFSNNMNAFLILAQELEKWPQERPMALRIAKTVYDGMGNSQNNFFKNIAGLQVLRIATAMGDHKTVQATLRSLADSMREQRAANGGQVPIDQALTIVSQMVQEGMIKEATDMLTDTKTDPQLANGNTYYQQKVDQAQKEIDFAKGSAEASSLVYGVAAGGKGGTDFFWELSPEKGQNAQSFQPEVDWSDGVQAQPTSYRIEVNGGPDDAHVTTKIASYDNVNLRGSAPLKIPPGTQVLQAVLVRTKALSIPPPANPAPVPEVVDTGHIIPLGGAENLLKNPEFKETKDTTGKPMIAGWHGIMPTNVSQETGGPLPTGSVSIEINNGMFGMNAEIVADRIAIQPGTNYVLSGWARSQVNLGWRCLDADGKVLDTRQFGGSRNENRWWWAAYTLGEHTGRRIGGESIPAKTAFVEIFARPNQSFNLAGLSFRVWPTVTPAPTPATPPPAPTTTHAAQPPPELQGIAPAPAPMKPVVP
jgi:tetratricopeptide (TPR) repeat protein